MDQGGELWTSDALRRIVLAANYTMEPTGNDCPQQNGKVERLNGTYGVMVRALLYSAGLPPKYWSAALLHAVHLKNRLWHSAIDCTPYQAWTGKVPDISHLRVFGSLISPRRNGPRPAKLDKHTYDGIFLGYTSTYKNIVYIDTNSGRVKHCQAPSSFDESHFSSERRPPGPQFLFNLGLFSITPPIGISTTNVAPLPALYPPSPCIVGSFFPPLPSLATLLPLPFGDIIDTSDSPAFAASLTAPEVMSIALSGNPFGPSFTETISIVGQHPTAGLETR